MANFQNQGQTTWRVLVQLVLFSFIIELIQDRMVIYVWTKSGADWLIFVDARV